MTIKRKITAAKGESEPAIREVGLGGGSTAATTSATGGGMVTSAGAGKLGSVLMENGRRAFPIIYHLKKKTIR